MKTLVVGGVKRDIPKGYRHLTRNSHKVNFSGVQEIIFITTHIKHPLLYAVRKIAIRKSIPITYMQMRDFKRQTNDHSKQA